MKANNFLRCALTSRGEQWYGNTRKSITRIPNAREHIEQLMVVQDIQNDFVNVVQWTRVCFTANMTVQLIQV